MSEESSAAVFAERPTEMLVSDAYRFGSVPLLASALCGLFGLTWLAALLLLAALFVAFFFRNPDRFLPGNEQSVVSPADGRIIAVGEIEEPDGTKLLRVGIFLSVFNVHVNRLPVSGRVTRVERSGDGYLAAFNPDAEARNVRCALTIERDDGVRIRVIQITGLIARRIVCHPKLGEYVRRGDRYGLIRFGSRTDVVLPLSAELRVMRGDRVKGGSSVLAVLTEAG